MKDKINKLEKLSITELHALRNELEHQKTLRSCYWIDTEQFYIDDMIGDVRYAIDNSIMNLFRND